MAAAAADLAEVLEDFVERVGVPGTDSGVQVTIGTGHNTELRTVRMPADVVDWITEALREEIDTLPHYRDDVTGADQGQA
ncbi:hypothetical protein [Kitasatospora sp. NPDC088346]|uniref:hypothetical protein n=1 Tax=Kitasatospora sp. NPDC088346 TaxID=3364073 RepID=UPI0037F98ED1